MQNSIVELITTNIWTFVIAIILCLSIVLFIVKRLFKLAIFAAVILLVYMGYLFFTGQKVPTTVDEMREHGSEQLKKYQIEEKLQRTKESIKNKAIEEFFKPKEKDMNEKLKERLSEII